MWDKPAVQEHVDTLRRRGVWLAGPVEGPLASGEVGMGRLADPEAIAAVVEAAAGRGPLAGRTVLVTAGPTHEPVDPVRFLGNRSSGKMGFALAAEAARRGARTLLVAGPVALPTPSGVTRIDVTTAREMERAVREHAPAADLVVMAAAVADFRPRRPVDRKIKKSQGLPVIDLEENPDILAGLAELAPGAVRVGFAAETDDLERYALAKLETKGADFLVANDVSRPDIAFESEANEVTLFHRDGPPLFFPRRSKTELAAALLDRFTAALADHERRPAVTSI
jgi:phosphopantothenoylcysteine decarboxylase/phosphopantothenate--cysteine ligase